MRVAQIMLARGFGGGERLFVDLCATLAACGHAVLAIGAERSRALDMLAGQSGIDRLPVRNRGTWDPLCRRAIAGGLRRFAPDVAHMHLARASSLGGAAARSLGLPSFATLHSLVKLKYYRAVDVLVPTTVEQKGYLLARGLPAARITRIPNFRAIDAAVAARPPSSGAVVVKSLGRFVHKKGFDILLRAFALVVARGVCARLEIGGDGPERDKLIQLATALGVADKVVFPGWIDDAGFLADADLFVLPSRFESFGIVMLEAMACGVPIVTTRIGGPREVLNDSTALFVAPDDAEAMADAMSAVFAEPATAVARANTALRVFKVRYSAPVVVDRYLEAYAERARQRTGT